MRQIGGATSRAYSKIFGRVKRVHILMSKSNGILNHVIAAQLSCNIKQTYKIFERDTVYQADVEKKPDMVIRSRCQLVKADV